MRTPAGLGEAHDNNASSTTITSTSLDDHASVAADGATTVTSTTLGFRFQPLFVPVLEHHPNTRNLDILQDLLRSEQLATKYGGMIFTSQRAVEAWSEVVKRVEGHFSTPGDLHGIDRANPSSSTFGKAHSRAHFQVSFSSPFLFQSSFRCPFHESPGIYR